MLTYLIPKREEPRCKEPRCNHAVNTKVLAHVVCIYLPIPPKLGSHIFRGCLQTNKLEGSCILGGTLARSMQMLNLLHLWDNMKKCCPRAAPYLLNLEFPPLWIVRLPRPGLFSTRGAPFYAQNMAGDRAGKRESVLGASVPLESAVPLHPRGRKRTDSTCVKQNSPKMRLGPSRSGMQGSITTRCVSQNDPLDQ